MKAAIKNIIEFFEGEPELFRECMEELDAYNGYLGDDRYYLMDDLDDLLSSEKPTDLLNLAFFGYDEDDWHTDAHGRREHGAFNPNRDYFKFNGYGNLCSTNYPSYSSRLDEYAISELCENRAYIDTIDTNEELTRLFDELDGDGDEV